MNFAYGVTASSTKNLPKFIIKNLSSRDLPSPPQSQSMRSVDTTHPSKKIPLASKKETLSKLNSVSMLMDLPPLLVTLSLSSLTKMPPSPARKLMSSSLPTKLPKQLSDSSSQDTRTMRLLRSSRRLLTLMRSAHSRECFLMR